MKVYKYVSIAYSRPIFRDKMKFGAKIINFAHKARVFMPREQTLIM